jgi:hypothetical protein
MLRVWLPLVSLASININNFKMESITELAKEIIALESADVVAHTDASVVDALKSENAKLRSLLVELAGADYVKAKGL